MADLFDLQAVTLDVRSSPPLSAPACAALSEICRQASQEVRVTLDALPVGLLNHELDPLRAPTPDEGDAARVPPDDDGLDTAHGRDR